MIGSLRLEMGQHRTLRKAAALGFMAGALALGPGLPPAAADTLAEGQALAARRQCLGCHQVEARRVGPPFRAIADRFQGRQDAAPYLARVMRQGSSGQWGAIPMPAQTRLSEADAMRLAQWILSLPGRAAD